MCFLLTTSSLAWTLMIVCASVYIYIYNYIYIYIYIYIYNCVFGSLISDGTCNYVSADGGKGWPVVACPSWALVVLYRMLTIFACYVLTFMFGMLFLFLTTPLGCFLNDALNMLPWTSFTCYTKDNQQVCFRLSNWFSLRRLGSWMNHLPPAW